MAKPSSVAETYHLTPHDHMVGNSPLHSACYNGKLDIVKLLILENPSDINGENHQGNTPLGLACKAGHKHVVSFLLTLNTCDLNHRNKAGNTPLHIASLEGDLDVVSLLCRERKCKADPKNRYGDTPLGLACNSGNMDIVEFLVNQKDCNIATQNRDGDTPLHLTCHSGHLGVVKLISNLPDCNLSSTNKDGDTPLHLACQNGWLDIVEYLTTEKGSDLNYQNLSGNIPLYTAIVSQQKDVSMFLCKLEHCDISHINKEGDTALHLASSDMVDVLVSVRHCDINSQDNQGNTALHIATLKGHKTVVEVLIQQPSCDIDCENQHGNTPLSLACQDGWEEIVELLINIQHCDLSHKNKYGNTPVHIACYSHHQRIVEILMQDKSRVDTKNTNGDTLLHLACSRGSLEVVKPLVAQKDCDINCRNNQGDTPFSVACQSSLEVVKFLSAQKRCHSFIQNNNGDTPLHHACRLDIVKYLVHDLKHDVNCENNDGNTPLSWSLACKTRLKNIDIVRFLASLPQCHINHKNKAGDTALHIACREGHLGAAAILSGVEHCNFSLQNKHGQTPAMVTMDPDFNHADILPLMLQEPHHIPSLLTSVSQNKWISIINLLSRGRELTVLSHFQSKLDAVKYVIHHNLWDPKCPNKHGSIALHFACFDLVEYLVLEQRCDINHQNKRGNTPLHVACLRGDVDTMRALTSIDNCDVNLPNRKGYTPLHIACLGGDLDTVKDITSIDERIINLQNDDGDTPLHAACLRGDVDTMRALTAIDNCDVNLPNREGNTPLHIACLRGDLDTVKDITSIDECDINLQNVDGDTPLHVSCLRRDLDTIRALTSECNANLQNSKGNTPLHVACSIGDLDIVRTLTSVDECHINLQNSKGNTPLHVACLRGDMDTVRALTSIEECTLNIQNNSGDTPLHLACQNEGWLRIETYLIIEKASNFFCHNRNGNTPTIVSHQKDVALFLCELEHCDVRHPNKKGSTVLHLASSRGWCDVVDLLVRVRHCDINSQDNQGNTALHIASLKGHKAVIEVLIQEPSCDVNHKNHHGNTPLSLACQNGWEKNTQHCNLNKGNKSGCTPALVPFNHTDILQLMLQEAHHIPSLLTSFSQDKWNSIINLLSMSRGRELTVPSHFQSKLDAVKFVVQHKLWDPKCPNERGSIALHFACFDLVEYLVRELGCDVNHQNRRGNTPLHVACLRGDLDIVKAIISIEKCNINLQNIEGNTPLHSACLERHTGIVVLLSGVEHCNFNHQNKIGNTPLHVACLRGDLDTVKAIISIENCNINLQNIEGNTPLHIACLERHTDVVVLLSGVEHCNFSLRNKHGQTPAMVTMDPDFNHADILPLMLQEPHHISSLLTSVSQNKWISIINLLSRGIELTVPSHFQSKLDAVKYVIQHKLWDPKCPNKHGSIALHFACFDLVEYLVLEQRCDINHQNKRGNTPLHVACLRGDLDTMRALTSIDNCDVNLPNRRGNTPLHNACHRGDLDTVKAIISIEKCNINLETIECTSPALNETAVHIAFKNQHTGIVKLFIAKDRRSLLMLLKCTTSAEWPDIVDILSDSNFPVPNFQSYIQVLQFLQDHKVWSLTDESGNNNLHAACSIGDIDLVKSLVIELGYDLDTKNNNGDTPLHIACREGRVDIAEFMVIQQRCETKSKFVSGVSGINIPNNVGNTPLHIACLGGRLSIAKILVHACNTDSDLVKFLVSDMSCDMQCQNSDGDTPMHIACQQGNLEVVRLLLNRYTGVNEPACNLDIPNNQGDTPLHCACSIGHVQIVKMLLSSDLFDPTSCNAAGLTPIELTAKYQMIKELTAYAKFRCSNSPPVWSNIKVCVVGDHSTGKTTLVEVLSRDATPLLKVVPARFRRVTDIECSTAGIILVRLQSKKFGNVILYDFAGHKEYYSSHAAVLERFRSTSPPPLFIILLKLTETREDISDKLFYWTSMIENHCKLQAKPPKVLIVGSFADEVRAKGGSVRKVSEYVQKTVKSFGDTDPASDVVSSSLDFVKFIPLDCRVQATGSMDELSKLLDKTCQGLQESSNTSFGCHILYTFLIDRFKGRVACSVAEIMESVQKEDTLALYNDAPSLVHLLKFLSDFGEIILLANQENPNQGWVILDSKVLLSEINATVFAPEYFKRYKMGFVMSTGVVPLSKIEETFPTYDSEMVTQFLTHLEFCQEIKDLSIIPEIRKTHQVLQQAASPSSSPAGGNTPVICYDQERYFFFPALVELEKPVRVWVYDETMQYKCGWLLRCIKPGKFLTTRFLHVLLLRLAFAYGLNPQPHESPEDDPVLRKQCSVWKSGIQWFSRTGIETVVEVREQTKVVAILMRCPKDKAVECAKLRSSMINKVLNMQREFCPAVTPMAESLIHPSDVEHPIKDARELRLFTVNEIANVVIANPSDHETHAIEDIPRGIIDTADLLLFEPYLGLGAEIVQQLFSSDNEITEQFLNQLASQTFERLSMYKKMINPNEARYAELCEQAPFNQVKQCFYLFQLWSERGNATFKALRQLFDGHSIFHERSPLELASSVPQLSGERTNEDDLLEGVNDTELAIDSLLPVRTELVTLTCWSDLGLAVQLLPHTLAAIRTSNRDDIHQCVTEVVAAWLERQGSVSKPSWRSLVKALLSPSINCQTLARRISATHSTSQSKPETYKSTTEHSTAQDNTVCCGSPQYEDSSFRHDLEIHQPTTEVSMSTVQGVDDDLLDDDSLRDIKDLLMAGRTHLPWFSLGLVLGLQYGTLKAIQDKKHDDHYQYLTDTLAAWLRQEDAVPEQGLPSWKTLARALTHPLVSQRSLVDEITRRHQKTEPSDN